MLRLVLTFFLIFSQLLGMSQVQKKSFDLLLRSMLKESVKTISVKELSTKDLAKYTLLDARELNEFQVSHLQNAKWIGYETFDTKKMAGIPKDQPIVIYCSIGVRSEKIGEKLMSMGYKNVQNLYGSIFEWVNQGNVVYDKNGKPTNKVHAYSKSWGIWLDKGEKVY
jgi:rhodanese-related sulfurtransferase